MPDLELIPRKAAKPAPKPRRRNLLAIERKLWSQGIEVLAGIDEVGRGPLAGPVVAAAVVMPPNRKIRGVDDSKVLSAARREELVIEIRRRAIAIGIGAASCREIDRINILRATALAMSRAVRNLRRDPDHLLVDGLPVPELGLDRQTAVVDGDSLCHSIACASIVAKVCRDRLMQRLATRYPQYGWERNKGYGTPEHREALREHGFTRHHRLSFEPIEQLSLTLET